jgi:positive regulator of sigma E activity
MLSEIGTVSKINRGIVTIMINRKQPCTGCDICYRSNDGSHMIAEAKDFMGVSVGDLARIESSSSVGPIRAGLVLYMLPILLLIFGYFLGQPIARSMGINTSGEAPGIVSGFLLMGFAYLGIYLITHLGKQSEKTHFKVVEIIRKSNVSNTGNIHNGMLPS